MNHEPGVGAAPRLRRGGRHFQNLDGIAFGRVLRGEALREDGRRVRLDALELAEAGPGDAHCCLIDARVGWRRVRASAVCRVRYAVLVDRNGTARCKGVVAGIFWHRCCSAMAP